MVEHVLIYRKAIAASVHQATEVKIAKMKTVIAAMTHVRRVPCARTNQAMATTRASVAVDTLATSVTSQSIHAQPAVIHAQMVPIVELCNKADSSVNVRQDGVANCVMSTSMIVQKIHVCSAQIAQIWSTISVAHARQVLPENVAKRRSIYVCQNRVVMVCAPIVCSATNAFVTMDGKDAIATLISTIVLKIHAQMMEIVLI